MPCMFFFNKPCIPDDWTLEKQRIVNVSEYTLGGFYLFLDNGQGADEGCQK